MKQIFAFLAVIALANAAYLGKNSHGIDIFTINLDDAPDVRFNETSVYFKNDVHSALQHYLDLIPTFLLDLVSIVGSYIRFI